ncbi:MULTISPECIES: nucleotidyltransferase family protein [unclassified Ensifer]|uniref:nucleotidyltransferase family protein n=1 Tax=unclassified Ensifer TaxID=2633371 RepID=UPI0008818A3F|nr:MULTISPECIES: nucleotidyltransferase family protein [unclassified Ensifer]MBD9597523.1 nucleotidyltransferase family protein [Ensifer sp. ENS05]SDM66667.1 Uncharacterised nucleotidyltransferase [Ensifer sp. YR511]
MTGNSWRDLVTLASCLNGQIPKEANWDGIVALANRSLTITSLAGVVKDAKPHLPEDLSNYLSMIYRRNTERNCRLKAQLGEAAASLNEIGIEPVVLKGTAILASAAPEALGARLLTDLDILVRPQDMRDASKALCRQGYEVALSSGEGSWPGNAEYHLPVVLIRPTDVGSIDLQCRPKGPASFGDAEWLYGDSCVVVIGEGRVRVPTAFAQIILLILHDQFQDGDYWRGLLDLRHLLDIATLARASSVDWNGLKALFANGYERNAVETQIVTAAALFGLDRTAIGGVGSTARIQFARRRFQLGCGYLRPPLTLLTLMSEVTHYRSWDRFGGEPYPSMRRELVRKARELRRNFRAKPPGKL